MVCIFMTMDDAAFRGLRYGQPLCASILGLEDENNNALVLPFPLTTLAL